MDKYKNIFTKILPTFCNNLPSQTHAIGWADVSVCGATQTNRAMF